MSEPINALAGLLAGLQRVVCPCQPVGSLFQTPAPALALSRRRF